MVDSTGGVIANHRVSGYDLLHFAEPARMIRPNLPADSDRKGTR